MCNSNNFYGQGQNHEIFLNAKIHQCYFYSHFLDLLGEKMRYLITYYCFNDISDINLTFWLGCYMAWVQVKWHNIVHMSNI